LTVKRYLSLIGTFIRQSLQQEMAFRINFFINMLNSALTLMAGVGGVVVVFARRDSLNGWSFAETLAVLGVYLLVQALTQLVITPSLGSIAGLDGDLWTGRFDFTLLKPLPAQFYVSFRKWIPWALVDVLVSMVVLGFALGQLKTPTIYDAALFLAALLTALIIVYALLLLLSSAAFWYLGTPLMWIYDSLMQLGRFPVSIYPSTLRNLLTWIVPVAFIITIPAEVLIGKSRPMDLMPGFALAIALLCISGLFFRESIRKYSSASS
jgi:ABC-2 type transport system permease protein